MKSDKNKISRLESRLLNLFLPESNIESLNGDFLEIYSKYREKLGFLRAKLWLWRQILKSAPLFFMNSLKWSFIMFRNYFTIALRNLLKNKTNSLVKIFSLSIGLAGSILLTVYVLHEVSYDRFYENYRNLYRVEQDQFESGNIYHVIQTPHPLSPALKEEIPEVIDAVRYCRARYLVKYRDKQYYEDDIKGVDASFLKLFTFTFLEGNGSSALDDPYSVVLTKNAAIKYFSNESPIGKSLFIDKKYMVTVTGVLENIPSNSSLDFDMLVPYKFLEITGLAKYTAWWSNNITTFVNLSEMSDLHAADKKITDLVFKKTKTFYREKHPKYLDEFLDSKQPRYILNPVADIHLREPKVRQYIYILSVFSIALLVMAIINFINLSTAGYSNRAKEIGVRKVMGALKSSIIRQFITESVIISAIAFLISLILAIFIFPEFNNFTQKTLSLSLIGNFQTIFILIMIIVLTGITAGIYPALVLSSLRPADVLKSGFLSKIKGAFFRRSLVIFQFTVFIVFIVSTITIFNQVKYLQTKDPGFNKEHLCYISLKRAARNMYPVLKNELLKNPEIISISASEQLPFNNRSSTTNSNWEGKDKNQRVTFHVNFVDNNFIKTLGLELNGGENFKEEMLSEESNAVIVNEAAEKIMNFESAAGKNIMVAGINAKVIGVFKNFNFQPLKYDIDPLALFVSTKSVSYLLLRTQGNNISSTIKFLETVWKKIYPDDPFEFSFFDDTMNRMYINEERLSDILRYILVLIAFIACLGLYGLVRFTTGQRKKEIGIRKILGSSASAVFSLLVREFVIWIILANVIAVPVVLHIMNNWLRNFAYRVNVGWHLFVYAGLITAILCFATIIGQTVKAATANPVESIRNE